MLRAVLLGVLAVSAAASCKSKADAPAVAVGTAAGKVVELSGKVEATREGKTRTLALGAEVFADDQIATSEDATVTIELFHNGAKWAVQSNKKARVDASLAWGLDKQEASKAVEHNSAAAGRNAERSAAETSSTTQMKEEARAESVPAPASTPAPVTAPEPMPAPASNEAPGGGVPGGAKGGKSSRSGGASTTTAPPPPPPPKVAKPDTATLDEGAPKDLKKTEPEREKAAVVITPQKLAEKHRPQFQKCLDPQAPKVTITIDVRNDKATVSLSGPGNITDKVRSCAQGVAQNIDWPVKGSTFQVRLQFD